MNEEYTMADSIQQDMDTVASTQHHVMEAAQELANLVNIDNINSIDMSIHHVKLDDIPDDWEYERIGGHGDPAFLVAKGNISGIRITAYLDR